MAHERSVRARDTGGAMKVNRGDNRPRHPIRVVAQRTGLTPDVLRAWEKRYGVVTPERTETGQRLYTDGDVERLRLLRQVTEAGRAIGRVADLSVEQLRLLAEEDETHRQEADRDRLAAAGEDAAEHVEAALEAVVEMDPSRLDAVLMQAALRVGSRPFLERVAVPLMYEVGDRWHAGALGIANEHMATAAVERVLGWLMWSWAETGAGPVLIAATPVGQRHTLGALLSTATAAEEGWRVVYLGADVPAAEIVAAVERRGARLVALSTVHPEGDPAVDADLRELGRLLPEGVGLVVGGAAAQSYADAIRDAGGTVMTDLASLRSLLDGYGVPAAAANGGEPA